MIWKRCAVATVISLICVAQSFAQDPGASEKSQGSATLAKLSPPPYPEVARLAHITGDVELRLTIRQDGSVGSINVTTGPPLLQKAAVDSVRASRFDCRDCSGTTDYAIVYTFQIDGDCACPVQGQTANSPAAAYPRIAEAQNRVTITAHIVCTCDPASDFRKKRSMKCLYLWRCGQ